MPAFQGARVVERAGTGLHGRSARRGIAQELPSARLRTTIAELLVATGMNRCVLTAVDADLAIAVNEALRPVLDN